MTTIPTITNEQEYLQATKDVANLIVASHFKNLSIEEKTYTKKLAEEVIRYREANNLTE